MVYFLKKYVKSYVNNLFKYSKDIMERWSYPLVPDLKWGGEDTSRHISSKHNVYKQPNVTLAK